MLTTAIFISLIAASFALGPCEQELKRLNMRRALLGRFTPTCDEDGNYAAKQCFGSVCYCVDKLNIKLGFEKNIGLAIDMQCSCARAQDEYRKTGLIGKMFRCDEIGNFDKVQCSGSVCYCADENGEQLLGKEPKEIGKMHELEC